MFAIAMTVALASMVLSGCVNGRNPRHPVIGGQSMSAMERAVRALPGIVSLQVDATSEFQPFHYTNGMILSVTVTAGYRVADGAALVDFLIRSAWSVNNIAEPNDSFDVFVTTQPGDPFNAADYSADWDSDSTNLFPTPTPGIEGGMESNIFLMVGDSASAKVASKLGRWPGAVPVAPVGALVRQ